MEAVAQITKSGFVFVLDRLTGKSLFPLLEKKAFPSDVSGEVVAPTQVEPKLPAPFARQHLTAELLTQRSPEAAAAVATQFRTLRSRGLWDPPSEQGTILFPGMDGGGEWGGAAFDPETGLLYVNSSEMAWIVKLKKSTPSKRHERCRAVSRQLRGMPWRKPHGDGRFPLSDRHRGSPDG